MGQPAENLEEQEQWESPDLQGVEEGKPLPATAELRSGAQSEIIRTVDTSGLAASAVQNVYEEQTSFIEAVNDFENDVSQAEPSKWLARRKVKKAKKEALELAIKLQKKYQKKEAGSASRARRFKVWLKETAQGGKKVGWEATAFLAGIIPKGLRGLWDSFKKDDVEPPPASKEKPK
jgi:hypothetical protein